jgi:hypothetical protein
VTITLAEMIVQVRADMDKLRDDVIKGSDESGKKGGEKLGKSLVEKLNSQLKTLDVSTIDIKADPRKALAEIDKTEARLKALARDSATVEIKVKSEKALSDLGRFKKTLGKIGDDGGDIGNTFFKSFSKSFADGAASSGAGSPLLIAGGVIGVIMAPAIGASVGAAIAGGVGLGGIIGGIALVAKDPAIKGYGKRIGASFMEGITNSADVFKVPVLNSLNLIESASSRAAGRIGQIFRNTAPSVEGLSRSLVHVADVLGDSLVTASAHSAPALKAIGNLADGVGTAISGMITTLSKDSKQGASALDDLTDALVNTVNATTILVDGLAHIKGGADGFDKHIDDARFGIEDFFTKMSGGRVAFDITADGFTKGSAKAEAYRNKVTGTASAQDLLLLSGQKATTATNSLKDAQVVAAVTADDVKRAQAGLTTVQNILSDNLASLGGATSLQSQRSAALKTAMDNLYGATMRQSDANQTYEASWDALSGSIKDNGKSLNIHTEAGRANRTALIGLFNSTNELYIADIAAGDSIARATRKHEARTEAVRKESIRLGLNKAQTEQLNNTYGKIPPKKTTALILAGVNAVVAALKDLYLFQRALADGIPIASEKGKLNKSGPDKKFGGYKFGGQVAGWSPSKTADDKLALLTAREWVHPVDAVDYYGPQIMEGIQKKKIPRWLLGTYAEGGQVAPVDRSTRIPFRPNVSGTHIMTRAQAASKVQIPLGSFGNWPASPGAQRGDSGVWRKVVALIKSTGPLSGSFGNGYRAGDPLWHGSGRAVDWMGFNQDALATFLANRRPLELIHRSNKRDYAYTRGVNKGSFNSGLMQAHRNHVHIAMAQGGQVPGGGSPVGGRMDPGDIAALADAIGGVVAHALMGTVPATRVAARQAGRRASR